MAEIGWIKLHRKLLDNWVWKEKPFDKGRAWVDLLLMAMHCDKKTLVDNDVIIIPRGSLMTSIVKLADRWGWSRGKVMRFLDVLECEQMLNTKRTPNGTLVTIVKYEDYQLDDTTNGTPNGTPDRTADRTADGTQIKNIKNIKNIKKESKESAPPQKHKYGEYKNVLLTDEELAKIKAEYPTDYKDRIENLSSYLASKNVSYKSHYAVIRRWAREDAKKKEVKDEPAYIKNNPFLQHQQSDTDYDAIEKVLAGK